MPLTENRPGCLGAFGGTFVLRLFLCAALLVSLRPATGAVLYSFQNGALTDRVDVDLGVTTDMWWANQFTVQPGGERITSVSIAFGGGWAAGTPVSVLVYEDPNDDGLPGDLVLVAQVDTTIAGPATTQNVAIPVAPQVSGSFFVGALVLNAPGTANIR